MLKRSLLAAAVIAALPHQALADSHSETPTPAAAEDDVLYACKTRTGEVALTFKPETDLKDLIAWVMGFTCKNFILDPRYVSTTKRVTIVAPNKMTAAEAYKVFHVALSTIGLTVVPEGNMLRIVESPLAKKESLPIYKTGLPDGNEQVVRYFYRPAYATGDTLLQGFNALKSDAGDVQLVGGLLMITDYSSHVRDMMSLGGIIDVPGGSDGIYTIPILKADVSKLAVTVGNALGISTATPAAAARPGAPAAKNPAPEVEQRSEVPSKLLVDERTNTMIVVGSPASYRRVKALAERLDIALDIEGGATMHVFHLSSAVAEDMAKTLSDTISGQSKVANKNGTPGASPANQPPPTDGSPASLEGQVHVVSDKMSNSLIVMSSGRDYLAIKDVIRQLDQPRRQVFIETVMLEVDIDSDLEGGVSAHGALPTSSGNAVVLGGVQTGTLSSLNLASLSGASGLLGGLIGAPLANSTTLLGQSIPSYGILFNALANNANTHSKKTPSFIGLDNQKIHWSSGVDIPYKKGIVPSFTGGTTTAATTLTTNIDRKKLELLLDITPHISYDDNVMLEIHHTNMDLGPDQEDLGPTWTTEEFDTSLIVHDQETIVLEGLVQEHEVNSSTKVPILGDIPLLGYLFKYTTKTKKKTNLLLMLTPYIVKDQLDLQQIKERKMREHDNFVRTFTALEGMKYEPAIDYRKKRGVIEEINRALISVEEDVAAANAITHTKPVIEGQVPISAPVNR